MNTQYQTTETVATPPIGIDLKPIIENGESPTAIIIALTIFMAALLSSITKLITSIVAIRRHDKAPDRQ